MTYYLLFIIIFLLIYSQVLVTPALSIGSLDKIRAGVNCEEQSAVLFCSTLFVSYLNM